MAQRLAEEELLELSILKVHLDRGNPVIVGGQGKASQYYVVVYGYSNGCRCALDYITIDTSL